MATEIDLLRWLMAIGVTAGLLGLFAFVLKRFNPVLAKSTSGKKRLKIVESLTLDTKRRLVMVNCDGEEKLLLIGGSTDIELSPVVKDKVQQIESKNED